VRRFYAQALLKRGRPADRPRAHEFLDAAAAAYEELHMRNHAALSRLVAGSA
jgi:hypothetical protein